MISGKKQAEVLCGILSLLRKEKQGSEIVLSLFNGIVPKSVR